MKFVLANNLQIICLAKTFLQVSHLNSFFLHSQFNIPFQIAKDSITKVTFEMVFFMNNSITLSQNSFYG